MEPVQALILGIIQGLTEFLPVSSSGHLVIFQHLFGLKDPELLFDVSVHLGTLAAVIIFFWKDIYSIITSLIQFTSDFATGKASISEMLLNAELKLAVMIIVGSVPTAIIGLLIKKMSDQLFASVFISGLMLIITGTFLWSSLKIKTTTKTGFSFKEALLIGIVQGLAVMPGISRSGSTIVAGLFLGLSREAAARYSFLLSIPAIVGAQILVLKDLPDSSASLSVTVLGTVAAFIVGYFSLKFLLFIIDKGKLHAFAPYCWVVGILSIFLGL